MSADDGLYGPSPWAPAHHDQPADDDPDDVQEQIEMFRLATDMRSDLDRLEAKLGRPLLNREVNALTVKALEHVGRSGTLPRDFTEQALEEYYTEGGERPDLDSSDGFVRWQVERWKEAQPEPDDDREYDLDDSRDREAYMLRRLQGVPAEDFEEVEVVDDESEPD